MDPVAILSHLTDGDIHVVAEYITEALPIGIKELHHDAGGI